MNDRDKTKEQLINELAALRQRVVELEASETEFRRMEQALQESEERFSYVYSQSPIAIELYDSEGYLLDVNPACLDLFGVADVEAVRGFKLFEDPNVPQDVMERLLAGDAVEYQTEFDFELVKELDLYETTKSGRCTIDCLITPWLPRKGEPSGFLVHVRDITERKRAEERPTRRTRELEALRQVGLELTSQFDMTALLHSAVSRAMELLDGSASGLTLYDAEQDVLKSVTNAGRAVMPIGTVFERGQGLSGTIWETGRPVVIDRNESPADEPAISPDSPAVATVGVPITWGSVDAGEEFLGTLVVKADPPRTFSPADIDLLNLFATQAAIAIRNARLYESLQQELVQHKQSDEALRESAERFRQMAEHSRDVFWMRDLENLELLYVTPAYERLWGQSIEDAHEQPTAWLTNIHPEDRDRLVAAFEKQSRGEPTDNEYRVVWPDGSIHWMRDRVTPVLNEAGEAYRMCGVIEDITERKQAEEVLRRRNRELALLNQAGQAFSSTLDLDRVLVAVLDAVRNSLNVIACSIWMLDPETDELVCQQATGPQSESVRGWRLALEQGIVGSTVERGESLIVPDTRADGRYFPGVDQQTGLGLRSILSVPLRVKEKVIGALQAVDAAVGRFDAEDLALLELLAATAATHIENARLYEQIRRYADELERRVTDRTRDLSTLYEVTALASESLDLEMALEPALERVLVAMQSTLGAIYLLDEADGPSPSDGEILRLVVQRGLPAAIAARLATVQPGHGLVGWVFEHGESLLVPDISADHRVPEIPDPPPLAYVGVPIQVGGQPLGILGVLKGEDQPPFNMEEITLLTSIADHIGIVVESARLRRQVKRAAVLEERERLARELHDSITQSLYGLTLFATWARDLCEEGELEAAKERVVRIGETAQQALKEMRLLVYELRPELLEQDGLVRALQRRLDAVEKRAGVEASLEAETLGELPAPVEEGLYRIAQEALNNALKHATASQVTIRVTVDGEQMMLEIEDDGSGFALDAIVDQGGLGLDSMRERAERLGGTLTILSEPGRGTTVSVRLRIGE